MHKTKLVFHPWAKLKTFLKPNLLFLPACFFDLNSNCTNPFSYLCFVSIYVFNKSAGLFTDILIFFPFFILIFNAKNNFLGILLDLSVVHTFHSLTHLLGASGCFPSLQTLLCLSFMVRLMLVNKFYYSLRIVLSIFITIL